MAEERVKRLRDLVDRLERLPASPDRDRVLSEVRSRAVDVDTGITPRAMLPAREPAPPARPPVPRREKPPKPPYRPVAVPRPSNELEELIFGDDRLSLEEPSLPEVRAHGGRVTPPWALGLRG